MLQEIFNKVEQKPTSTNEECGILPRRRKSTFDFRTLATEPKWVVGHHLRDTTQW